MKIHPNSRTAWMLVVMTVLMSAGVVALAQLMGDDGRILYTHFDGNDYEIFVMDANGENLTQLTNNELDDWGASWSPDRSQIAFRSVRNGTPEVLVSEVFVMNADGSNVKQVSPDNLYTGYHGVSGLPSWSADGKQLAFEAIEFTDYNIYVANLESGDVAMVTNSPYNDWHPQFSPDGSKIAFASESMGMGCAADCDIYVMNADGSNVERYTYTDGMDVFPSWSPNGSQILFHSERYGDSDIFVMNADGSQQELVLSNLGLDRVARWSPDSQNIVFRSERDGDSDIYVYNLETGVTTPMTDNMVDDRYPDWK